MYHYFTSTTSFLVAWRHSSAALIPKGQEGIYYRTPTFR